MTTAARTTLILTLMLTPPVGLTAQEPDTTAVDAETAAVEEPGFAVDETGEPGSPVPDRNSYQVREGLSALLRHHPPELGTILALDPTLLSNRAFLEAYPDLARFVDAHREVRHNPRFYLSNLHVPGDSSHAFDQVFEGLTIFAVFLFLALSLAWLVRTVVEQKRWSRLSKTQAEVHTRLLERFGSSEELLQYMRTPAGSRFLESAPIPVQAGPAAQNAPLARIMWSIQIGVIVAAAAIGLLLVSLRLPPEEAEGLFAMGVVALCVGGGFVGSAFVSLAFSRRLGLWRPLRGEDADAAATASADFEP